MDCPVTFCRDKAELIVVSVSCSWEYCTPPSSPNAGAVFSFFAGCFRNLRRENANFQAGGVIWAHVKLEARSGFLRIFYVSLIAGLEENSLSPKNKHFERFLNSWKVSREPQPLYLTITGRLFSLYPKCVKFCPLIKATQVGALSGRLGIPGHRCVSAQRTGIFIFIFVNPFFLSPYPFGKGLWWNNWMKLNSLP